MIIDTQKLEDELKQALQNCGLPADHIKIMMKHNQDDPTLDWDQFGLFGLSRPKKRDHLEIKINLEVESE